MVKLLVNFFIFYTIVTFNYALEHQDYGDFIYINSDSLEFNEESRNIKYVGNVKAKSVDMDIRCKELTLLFNKSNKLYFIIAQGDVNAIVSYKDSIHIKTDELKFDIFSNHLLLTGNVTFKQKDNLYNSNFVKFDRDKELIFVGK